MAEIEELGNKLERLHVGRLSDTAGLSAARAAKPKLACRAGCGTLTIPRSA
jgi:hypothetical protein